MKKVISLVLTVAMLLSTLSLGVLFTGARVAYIPGDVNDDDIVDTTDAIYLLYNIIFGDNKYPLNQIGDFNRDADVNTDDAIYLLYHVIFGDENYPLEAPITVPDILVTDGTTIEGWSNAEGAGGGIPMPEIDAALGCVAATYSGNVHSNGGWNRPEGHTGIKIDYRVIRDTNYDAQAFDITGMNYLIFDLYVSNAAMLSRVRFDLELTSSGRVDLEEISWKMTLSDLKGSALTDGWNHFEINLSTYNRSTGGSFNSANWNILRIYNMDAFNAGEGLTIGFKNLGFSATSAAVEANKVATQRIINLYSSLADIDVGDITAANYRTVSAQLSAATQAYDRASAAVKAMVDEALNVAKIKRIVTRALEKYNNGGEPVVPNPPVNPPLDDYLMNIPQQNYGKTFTFLTDVGEDQVHELYFASEEEALGNTVDMAIYQRNNRVAEHLGVTFESMTAPGRWSDRNSYLNLMQQSFTAGDQDYQLASVYEAFAADGAIKGLYYDINSIDAIDIHSPWYVQSWLENTLINDQIYMILGDLSYRMWQNMNSLYFNKQLANELGISDELYTVAENGALTWDYIMSYAELAASEDGNDIWDQNDTYGMYFHRNVMRALVTYCDIPLTRLNDNDEYEICLYNERTESIYGEFHDYIWENDATYIHKEDSYNSAIGLEMFMSDRLLFLPLTLGWSQDLREMTGSFGILPMPKYTADQEYCSHANDNFNIFIIPSHTDDAEFCGTVMDALSAESKYSVIPTYYDVVLKNCADDDQSIRMLDIIRDNLKFDFSFAHLTTIGTMWTKFGESLANESKTAFKSDYDAMVGGFEQKLEEILDAYWRIR